MRFLHRDLEPKEAEMARKTRATTIATAAVVFVLAALPSPLFAASRTLPASSTTCITSTTSCRLLSGLAQLRATVVTGVPAGSLATSLETRVDTATAAVLAGWLSLAADTLDAFVQQVTTAEQFGLLTSSAHTAMSEAAEALKAVARKG